MLVNIVYFGSRYNPRMQRDDWYYHIKESFRDLIDRVRKKIHSIP